MDRTVFDNMDIINQVEYINKKLLEHGSLTKLCSIEKFRRGTIRDRFKRYGYELINNQYSPIDNPVEANKSSSNIINHINIKPLTEANKPPTNDIPPKEDIAPILDMIKTLQKEVAELRTEIHILKNKPINQSPKDNELIISDFDNNWQNRNFRINSNVLKEFISLSKKKKFSKYKKQDLFSQALKEFIEKYS